MSWAADKVLSGSFRTKNLQGNYDGKYYEKDRKLYLLYVKNLVPGKDLRNVIVIRSMSSPTEVEGASIELLAPGDRYGPLASENYAGTPAKLVEAPFIIRANGKHALIYSTGAYQHNDYKAGVAWSDSLIPADGLHYRKVLMQDPSHVWATSGPEVRYLLQSQDEHWPNFTPSALNSVYGPGVASANYSPSGVWNLFFAGYDRQDRPRGIGAANAALRRPFAVKFQVAVPSNASAFTVPDDELATWMVLQTRELWL